MSAVIVVASVGLPTELRPDDFSPHRLPRRLLGQGGTQRFFQVGGRAFGLYFVLDAYRRRDLAQRAWQVGHQVVVRASRTRRRNKVAHRGQGSP